MKKLFSIISLFALAAIRGISTVSAQKSIITLEKLWSKTTTEMGVSVTDSRQSAGRDGKVYLLNKANQSFVAISETGQDTIFQGPLTISEGVTANLDGTAFALDDAGNFVMVGAFNAIPSHIILRKADGSITKDLSIEGIARTDFINVSGDVFSAEGGYVFVYGYSANLLVYQIVAGKLVGVTEIAVPGCINGDYVVMGDVNTQIVHHRMANIPSWKKIEDNTETPIEGMEGFKPSTMGGDIITLAGQEFYIYPTGTTHYDSEFCVRNMTDGTFAVDKADGVSTTFAPNASEAVNKAIFACWLHAKKIDDNNAYIHVYNSQGAAVYKLSVLEAAIVTLDVNDATMGTVEGGGKIVVGENTTVKAIPQLGHSFVYWLNGTEVVSTDAEYTFAVTSDVTLTAVFQAEENKTLTLSVNDFDMGHIILPSGITLGENSVAYGQTVTLKAVPAKHHHFVSWSDNSTDNPRTITITSDITLTAEFAINEYTITLTSDANGVVDGSGVYPYGATATLTATPNEGYHFVQWSDGNTDNPRQVQVTGDMSYAAEFVAINEYIVTLTSDANGVVDGSGVYPHGATATLTATPNEGYHFVQWSDGNTDNPRQVQVTGDMNYAVEFSINEYKVLLTVDETGLTGEAPTQEELWANFNSAAGFGLGELNTISKVNTIAGVATAENLTAVFAKPEWQWLKEYIMTVQNAQKGNTIPGNLKPDGTERTVHGLKEDIALSSDNTAAWRFAVGAFFLLTQYTTGWPGTADFSESGKPEAWGSAYQAAFNLNGVVTGSGVYPHGATATLTAIPNEGYHFVQWSDGNTDNPRTMTIISDITLSAKFAINVYSVRFLDWNGTEIKGESVEYQSAATAPADPTREGYTFMGWDKDFSKVTEDMTITAQYQINRYQVRFLDYDGTELQTDSVEYQSAATAPSNPYRQGHTFIGWDKDFTSITSDLDIYAQYEMGEDYDMTIVFTNSEDNNSEIYSQSLTIKVPAAPEIVGFTFLYWQPVAEPLTDTITIQAIYKADTLTSAPEVYVNPANPAQKLLRNGHVYILRDGNTYTIQGQKLQDTACL